jgi:hydroxypyruvate isomerase
MNRRKFGQLATAVTLGQFLLPQKARTAAVPSTTGSKLSVMLWALEKVMPFDRCIEVVAAAGYQGVELVGEFQKWSSEDTRRILKRIGELGLVIDSMSGVRAGFCNPSESDAFLTQVSAQIQAARELQCPQIILLSGKRVEGLDPKIQYQTSIENLKRAAEVASKNNIGIVIEPIDPLENPTIYLTTVTTGFKMVREIGSENVRVLYDFYHEQRAFGNLLEKLDGNVDLVGLVHIADVPGRHEPGTGEVDYTNIYRKLAELRYDRFIAMEYYPTTDPEESLRKSRMVVQQALLPDA